MVVCPSCGINTSFCPNCGHSLTKDSIICDSCKKVINYCFNCNAPLRKVFEETKIKEIEASILEKPPKIS
ncbi:MAG: zinc ribbon domain-containing protein, partial [Nitrososphaerota archaeon]